MSTPNRIEKFRALEQDFGTTNAEALWKKVVRLMNYAEKSYPVGYVLFVHETQSLLPHVPDSKYWKAMDGTAVSNANSPINGVTLPDWRDKFFRCIKSGEVIFSESGANTVNLSHDHGGQTGVTDARTTFDADDGSDRTAMAAHQHAIASDIGSVATVPLYIALKAYLRVV